MEAEAFAFLAVHPHLAAHQAHQAFANRQAETGAAELAGDRTVGLRGGLKETAETIARNPDAGIADGDVEIVRRWGGRVGGSSDRGLRGEADQDLARGSELDGVAD